MKIIKRLSRILAMLVVYAVFAYAYLVGKGFVFNGDTPILSNTVQAKEEFSKKIEGELTISQDILRIKGEEKAPISIYVYSSMSCSHCGKFHKNILPKIEKDFVLQGKVKVAFVHLPVDVLSMQAAKLSYCLPKEKFDSFIEKLYDKKDWLFSTDDKRLNYYAKDFGMTDEDIQSCKDNKKLTSDILLARDNAIEKFGVSVTPSVLIVTAKEKELITGTPNYDELAKHINAKLSEL